MFFVVIHFARDFVLVLFDFCTAGVILDLILMLSFFFGGELPTHMFRVARVSFVLW